MDQPVHYLTALRRRWWVIVAAVLVAGVGRWFTTTTSPDSRSTNATAAYSATTVLWDPGAPGVRPRNPFTSTVALAQVVTLPDVVAIAAQVMDYQGSPLALRNQVKATTDPDERFLAITGYGAGPSSAETVSTAFSHALRRT